MRRAIRALLLGTAISALMTATVLAKAGGAPAVPLTTGQEADQVIARASGSFEYTINGTSLCYTLSYKNLSGPATAAHIHINPRGVPGPVVVPLTVGTDATDSVSACPTVDASLLAAIQADPGAYYVNVHTALYPPGEIRGQLK